MDTYMVNEVFYSLQGEGMRAGTANAFVRLSGCNLRCNGKEEDGVMQPVCDTEFVSGRKVTAEELAEWILVETKGLCKNIIFTGGEPALQLDQDLASYFKRLGYFLAIETNGTKELPAGLDWITCSPKTAEHTLKLAKAHEVKYVRGYGMGIPRPSIDAQYKLISPHVEPSGSIRQDVMTWCVNLVKDNPEWRLSCQQHKNWKVR